MSLNVEQVEIEKLRAVFPQCFNEGRLDLSKLLALLGEYDDNDHEKYKFEWRGKGNSLKLAQQRSMGTLRPAPAESVDWDTTQNLYIEGDNLEVLKLLQTTYNRSVKMIYIDPPYNTGNDFVYEDDFADPLARYKEVTGQTTKSNPETMGRFHTNWLNMMYPRLRLAANLLKDDGVIFISIDDNEVHNLRKLCDEVFGEENFLIQGIWISGRTSSAHFTNAHEYVLGYAKNKSRLPLFVYNGDDSSISDRTIKKPGVKNPLSDISFPAGIDFECEDKVFPNTIGDKEPVEVIEGIFECENGKLKNPVTLRAAWAMRDMILSWLDGNEVLDQKGQIVNRFFFKSNGVLQYEKVKGTIHPNSVINGITTKQGSNAISELLKANDLFDFPKPVGLVNYFARLTAPDTEDIILDFFSGSATTAHAVMQLNAEDGGNRRFIMVQLPEMTDEKSEAYKAGYKNICEMGKERIRRAGAKIKFEWEAEATKKNSELFAGQEEPQSPPDTGFKVFKLDSSNLKTWDATPVDKGDATQMALLLDRMNDMIDTIKNDRTDLDIIYEVMLKQGGVYLTDPVEAVEIDGKRAYTIGENAEMLLCLQEGLTAEIIEKMVDEYIPAKMILSEKCFADDTAMANAHYILKEREIELKLV